MKAFSALIVPTLFSSLFAPVPSQTPPTNANSLPLGSCIPDIPLISLARMVRAAMAGRVSVASETNSAALSAQAIVTPKAECGPDALPENLKCQLDVCCGQFGFCGTTTDFAGMDASRDALQCLFLRAISAEALTHINLAFTLISLISISFNIVEMTKGDSDLWKSTTALKKRNPTLKVFVCIGGWAFNDPLRKRYSPTWLGRMPIPNTKTFISSVLKEVSTSIGSTPAADDRGGIAADMKNYVTFMAALKKAFAGPKYGLTLYQHLLSNRTRAAADPASTARPPSSYWYLQHLDMPVLLKSAGWVNVMTYDLHGTRESWDAMTTGLGLLYLPLHLAFKLYWRVGVDPKQIVMGLGFYGQSFTLASPHCQDPGCIWTAGVKYVVWDT
ncbi:glycoside hydrolase superfamily [Mycena olivaceomarginata]|nr:glycoside hydrolase superfamily [Mycena olivaceomarginata]